LAHWSARFRGRIRGCIRLHEASGTLDLFVQGDKDLRHDIEEIFARLILKEELPTESAARQRMN